MTKEEEEEVKHDVIISETSLSSQLAYLSYLILSHLILTYLHWH